MSKTRRENWIKITTPENKDRIASPQYIIELLGLDQTLKKIDRELGKIKQSIMPVVIRHNKQRILELLSKEDKPRTSRFIDFRLDINSWYLCEQLFREKKLNKVKHGSNILYYNGVLKNE